MRMPLTHSLNCSAGGAKYDDNVHELWLRPTVGELPLKDVEFHACQTLHLRKPAGVLSEDGALLESSDILFVPYVVFECVCSSHFLQFCMTYASQGIRQFGRCIAAHSIGCAEGKFPGGGSTAVVLVIELDRLEICLDLWARGG